MGSRSSGILMARLPGRIGGTNGLVSKISDSLRRFTILAMVGRIEEEIGQLPVRRTEDGKRCVHPRLLEEIRKKGVRGELMEAFNKAFPEPGADDDKN